MARKRKSEPELLHTFTAEGVGSGVTGAIRMDEWDHLIVHVNITVGGTLVLLPHGSGDGTNFGPYRDELGAALTSGAALAVGVHAIAFSRSVLGRLCRLAWTVGASAVTGTIRIEKVKGGGGVNG